MNAVSSYVIRHTGKSAVIIEYNGRFCGFIGLGDAEQYMWHHLARDFIASHVKALGIDASSALVMVHE